MCQQYFFIIVMMMNIVCEHVVVAEHDCVGGYTQPKRSSVLYTNSAVWLHIHN